MLFNLFFYPMPCFFYRKASHVKHACMSMMNGFKDMAMTIRIMIITRQKMYLKNIIMHFMWWLLILLTWYYYFPYCILVFLCRCGIGDPSLQLKVGVETEFLTYGF